MCFVGCLCHNENFKRISALDPALPLFYPPTNATQTINVNDAVLVDVIHTDAGNYGAPVNTGCVDFVVNGGTRFQPGCPVGNFTFLDPNGNRCNYCLVKVFCTKFISRYMQSSKISCTLG